MRLAALQTKYAHSYVAGCAKEKVNLSLGFFFPVLGALPVIQQFLHNLHVATVSSFHKSIEPLRT